MCIGLSFVVAAFYIKSVFVCLFVADLRTLSLTRIILRRMEYLHED